MPPPINAYSRFRRSERRDAKSGVGFGRIALVVAFLFLLVPAAMASTPEGGEESPIPGDPGSRLGARLFGEGDVGAVGKIGRVHERIRAARSWARVAEAVDTVYGRYARLKSRAKTELGLSWSGTTNWLQQWGIPGGGPSSAQIMSTPGFDWEIFRSDTIGAGSLQASYTYVQYPWAQASTVAGRMGAITPINDYPGRGDDSFDQLTYTHALADNRVLLSIGQFPFYNFDGNPYLDNQQLNFNSYIFTQNGSATYAVAGLGLYAQINLTSRIQVSGGVQNATDVDGRNLTVQGLGGDSLAWFGYVQWQPEFAGLGSGQYSMVFYGVPTVPAQGQTRGWSLSASQSLGERWAIFGRANGARGYLTPIRQSYALGVSLDDPLGLHPKDQVGLALGFSQAAPPPTLPSEARNEKVLELYWNTTVFDALVITPSLQYIRDPSLQPERDGAWALSLRASLVL